MSNEHAECNGHLPFIARAEKAQANNSMREGSIVKTDIFRMETLKQLQAFCSQNAAEIIPDVPPDKRHCQHLLRVDILIMECKNNMIHIAHYHRPKTHDTRLNGSIQNDPAVDVAMDVLFGFQEGIQLGVSNLAVTFGVARPAARNDIPVMDDDRANGDLTGQTGLFRLF